MKTKGNQRSVLEMLEPSKTHPGCLEFQGARHCQGYGWVKYLGRAELAHRVAWREAHGSIPDGMFVCHHCDNPPCCNPERLFLGTRVDNMRDCSRKGRNKTSRNKGEANPSSRLTIKEVEEILRLHRNGGSLSLISETFNISKSHACGIIKGRIWRGVVN